MQVSETPDNTVVIRTPHSGDRLYIGTTAAVTGLATFEDGTEVRLYKTVNGTDTLIGTTTALNRHFLFDWTVTGDEGPASIKAVCGNAEASVSITLKSVIEIILPEELASVQADVVFPTTVESEREGVIEVYTGGVKIAELPVVDGIAQGNLVIPNSLVRGGSCYIVNGSTEEPVGNISSMTLTYSIGNVSKTVIVNVTGNQEFGLGTTSAHLEKIIVSDPFITSASTSVELSRVQVEDSFELGTTSVTVEKIVNT